MLAQVKDQHCCEIGGVSFWFRTPTEYDTPLLRHALTKRGIRRPLQAEIRIAASAGIKALGDMAGDPGEAKRQGTVMEDWYRLSTPISEDDIDEPDLEARAAELAGLQAEQAEEARAIVSEVSAIEAMLVRHWPPYAELLADRELFDEMSQIEIVRQLLVRRGDDELPRDKDGRLASPAYQAIPKAYRVVLSGFAMRLLVPDEDQEKN